MEVDALHWHSICRICLREGEMRSIFEEDIYSNLMICDKIIKCSNITIKRGMNLPEQICKECLDDLDTAYKFRNNCQNSEAILQSLIDGSSNNIITDLIVSSDNGDVYKYKPPSGLNVRRVKPTVETSTTSTTVGIKLEPVVTAENFNNEEPVVAEEDPFENADYIEDDDESTSNLQELEEEYIKSEELEEELFVPKKQLRPRNAKTKESNNDFEMVENGEVCTIKPVKSNKGRPKKTEKAIKQKKVKVLPAQNVTMKPDGTAVIRIRNRKVDEDKPIKICEICGNTYKYKHALESHMRRHRNEKPFACEICGRAFVINFELRRHMRTHTGQKPYTCRYCGRRFSDFGSRIKHERTHTGERPYACDTCGKAFSYSHVLQSHILTHTGEKRYACTLCEKRFTKSHHLKAHMNTHMKHSNKVHVNVVKKQQTQATITWSTGTTENITNNDNISNNETTEENEQKMYIQTCLDKVFFMKEKKEEEEEEELALDGLC